MTKEERKAKVQNCCANCDYAEDHTGFDDFFCTSCNYWRRTEQYNCKSFKPKTDMEIIDKYRKEQE